MVVTDVQSPQPGPQRPYGQETGTKRLLCEGAWSDLILAHSGSGGVGGQHSEVLSDQAMPAGPSTCYTC